jgi:hypothetical protein
MTIKQLTFQDLEEFSNWLEDQEPTKNDQTMPEYQDVEEPAGTTLLEDTVSSFLENCILEAKLPTLEEARVIYLLDALNCKYRGC